jgi:hypothetical protein
MDDMDELGWWTTMETTIQYSKIKKAPLDEGFFVIAIIIGIL